MSDGSRERIWGERERKRERERNSSNITYIESTNSLIDVFIFVQAREGIQNIWGTKYTLAQTKKIGKF